MNPLKTSLGSFREREKDIKILLFNPVRILHCMAVACKSMMLNRGVLKKNLIEQIEMDNRMEGVFKYLWR